jgi:hypothetical protein
VGPQIRKFFQDDNFNIVPQRDVKKSWTGVTLLPRVYQSRKPQGIDWGHVVIVSQTWLQYVLKDTHVSFILLFFPPRKLRHG